MAERASGSMMEWQHLPGQLILWTIICLVSAGPSFVWAMTLHKGWTHVAAMLTGIGMFIAAYTLVGCTWFVQNQRRTNRAFLYTVRIGYGTRVAASIIFPIGMAIDLWLGLLSIELVRTSFGFASIGRSFISAGFTQVLLTTLVQGLMLNAAVGGLMMIVYPIARAQTRTATPNMCMHCGYDLRASKDICPECGTAIVRATRTH